MKLKLSLFLQDWKFNFIIRVFLNNLSWPASCSICLTIQARKEVKKMSHVRLFLSVLLVAGMLAYSTGAMSGEAPKPKGVKPGVTVVAVLNRAGTYCHLKFPAIDPGTLGSSKPRLQDAKTGSMIDYYGPCDHDPIGYDEVCKQRVQQAKQEFCD
jgi:hypothetical protein